MVVMSGDVGCWCALFGTLVGVSVLSVMWLELESVSEISSPRWSSVYECHTNVWRFVWWGNVGRVGTGRLYSV